jgi:hypothetical protein
VAVIGDVDAPVAMDREAVRPAVVLGRNVAFAAGREAQDAAERYVDDIQKTGAVKRRGFEKAIEPGARVIRG